MALTYSMIYQAIRVVRYLAVYSSHIEVTLMLTQLIELVIQQFVVFFLVCYNIIN